MPTAQREAAGFDVFLAGLGARDKANIEKHLAALDAANLGGHVRMWRRLAATMRRHAPALPRTAGQGIVQFYVPDGKYQMQVFTLEDSRDGKIIVCMPDILNEAIKAKILAKPAGKTRKGADDEVDAMPIEYPIAGSRGGEALTIESLTPTNTPAPPAHMKHMLGWNRKALRVTFAAASAAQAEAVEAMCALAAKAWEAKS